MSFDANQIATTPSRLQRALLVAVGLPSIALALLGARVIQNERMLEERRVIESRARMADEMSRAIVDQLQGILSAEAAATGDVYVEDATAFVALLDSSGPRLSAERRRRLSPADAALFAHIANDSTTLTLIRGALGEPHIVARDSGRMLVTLHYSERGGANLVGVRTAPLVAAAGVALGDSVALLHHARPGTIQLGYGIDGLWFAWRDPPTVASPWRGTGLYYLLSLILVGSLGTLGVYLVARDAQREANTARLRHNFIAAVSHELKTPMTSIRVFAETLRDRPLPQGVREEYLSTMVNETERLSRLVDNVLEFTRIERGDRVYRLVDADVVDVVHRAVKSLEYPFAQHGFRVQLALPDRLPPLRIDPDALEQVLLNLLGNAMKYSGTARTIEVVVASHADQVRITVRDSGIGISSAEQHRIFERFYRSPSLPPEIAGTGLGLTLVHYVVTAHGGRVAVESEVGQGSTFTVSLPARGAA